MKYLIIIFLFAQLVPAQVLQHRSTYYTSEEEPPFDDGLLTNGDFETGDLTGWALINQEAGDTTEVRTTKPFEGTYSLYVSVDLGNEGLQTDVFGVTATQNYTVVAKVWIVSGQVIIRDVNNRIDFTETLTTTGQWLTVNQTPLTAATTGNERLYITSTGGAARFYVDNVGVE